MEGQRLSEAWESEAPRWAAWAGEPGLDSYWRFHREAFLALLPEPRGLTVDVGAGEGRVSRDLAARGHRVISLDRSPSLVRLAAAAAGPPALLADAACLPLIDCCASLVVAFMCLQDVDDMAEAVGEIARVLEPGGRLCLAVVHPVNGAGGFATADPDAPFVIRASYFERRRYAEEVERAGFKVTFHSHHRSLEEYFGALEAAGLLTERVREPPAGDGGRWDRVPLFLHIRAVRPGR
ncbi:MAG: class I SAM-dependent methyltransferase [Candidatus Dormibacteraceae bacterium]